MQNKFYWQLNQIQREKFFQVITGHFVKIQRNRLHELEQDGISHLHCVWTIHDNGIVRTI